MKVGKHEKYGGATLFLEILQSEALIPNVLHLIKLAIFLRDDLYLKDEDELQSWFLSRPQSDLSLTHKAAGAASGMTGDAFAAFSFCTLFPATYISCLPVIL